MRVDDGSMSIAQRRTGTRPWFVITGEPWHAWLSDAEVADWTPLVAAEPVPTPVEAPATENDYPPLRDALLTYLESQVDYADRGDLGADFADLWNYVAPALAVLPLRAWREPVSASAVAQVLQTEATRLVEQVSGLPWDNFGGSQWLLVESVVDVLRAAVTAARAGVLPGTSADPQAALLGAERVERAQAIIGNVLLASTQTAWKDLNIPPRRWAAQAVREMTEAGLLTSGDAGAELAAAWAALPSSVAGASVPPGTSLADRITALSIERDQALAGVPDPSRPGGASTGTAVQR
jgi:hypothetical protein